MADSNTTVFYPVEEEFKAFGTSMKHVAVELFRINGGKPGYYIANILDKKYYYCGVEWKDVKAKLFVVQCLQHATLSAARLPGN